MALARQIDMFWLGLHLFFLFLTPTSAGFIQSHQQKPRLVDERTVSHWVKLKPQSPLILDTKRKDIDIDEVTSEAEAAIREAQAALDSIEGTSSKSDATKKIDKQAMAAATAQKQAVEAFRSEAFAAVAGGVVVGAGLGLVIGFELAPQLEQLSISVNPVIPSFLGAAVGAGGTSILANQDSRVGRVTRNILGKPALGLARGVADEIKAIPGKINDAIQRQVESATNEVKAIPGRAADAVKRQVDDVANEVKAIPGRVSDSIQQKAEETAQEIQALPQRVSDAAIDAAEDLKEAAIDAAEDLADEIKATPGRVADSTKRAVERTVDDTKQKVNQAVDDVVQIPTKTINEITSILEGSSPKSGPKPPDLPPPKSIVEDNASKDSKDVGLGLPSIDIPKVSIPKVNVPELSVPKLDLPKIEPPKVDLPSISISRSISLRSSTTKPKPPKKQAPPPPKKKPAKTVVAKKPQQTREQKAAEAAARTKKKLEEQAAKQEQRAAAQAKVAAQKEEQRLKREKDMARQLQQDQSRKEASAKKAAAEKARREKEAELKRAAAEKARLEAQKKADAARAKEEAAKRKQAALAKKKVQVKAAPQKAAPKKSAPKLTKAPRGVPTIIKWRARRDGGISGRVYGSPNFSDGDRVETSPIVSGSPEMGTVVKTDSGSRYFLSDVVPITDEAMKTLQSARSGATITLTRIAKARDAQAAKDSSKVSKPRSTFSLFGVGLRNDDVEDSTTATKTKPAKKAASKKAGLVRTAPRGVPTLNRWRKNRDGSVTGLVSGSTSFREGEKVTTSPIAVGKFESGEIVRTSSGSRYFLA